MLKSRKAKGFTLVELLVVVVIIGILAAIALPNFIGAQKRAKNASVKGNMRTVQIAAESYAVDSGGAYGDTDAEIGPFLPGGDSVIGGNPPATYPSNPISGAPSVITPTAYATSQDIQNARTQPGTVAFGTPGDLGYNSCDAIQGGTGGNSYAVTGGDADGNMLTGVNNCPLILSNQ